MNAKQLEIGQKRKRGRPGLAKKGLRRQDSESRYATFESMLVHDPINLEIVSTYDEDSQVASVDVPEGSVICDFCKKYFKKGGIARHKWYCKSRPPFTD